MPTDRPAAKGARRWRLVYRHAAVVRVTHWVNVVCLAILLMSGLQIFNAHPALYWGARSDFDHPLLAMTAAEGPGGAPVGLTVVLGRPFDTTGWFGLSTGPGGRVLQRGFPAWITLPSWQDLATGRRWHFLFAWLLVANGAAYLLYGLIGGHFRRDLLPSRDQLRHVGRTVRDHLLLRFPKGEAARRYNVLQKLAYLSVIFVLLPVMVLAGLAISPGLDAAVPVLPAAFGGRQSARTIHFVIAWLLVLFALAHVVMVLLSGVWNNLRAMVTGRYAIATEKESHGPDSAV